MITPPYPRGAARAIADARAAGMKPSGVVVIVLAGHFDWPDPVVYATPGEAYCWDWVNGLSVVVLTDSKTHLKTILSDIELARPFQLDVIDAERRRGWLVTRATQRLVETVRWPRFLVDDWLGTGEWHRELERIKAEVGQAAEARRQAKPTFEPEAIWT